jgi:hypothetical protein
MSESSEAESESRDFTYTLAQVAHVLAPAVLRPGEDIRAAIDKARKRVMYATEKGELQTWGVPGAHFYSLPLVIAWARQKWPGKLDMFSARQKVEVKEAIGLGDQLVSFTYPGDLDRSHEQLKKAYKQINDLAAALKAAYAEIDRLEPLAEKYEMIREKNRISAKLPRGGQS